MLPVFDDDGFMFELGEPIPAHVNDTPEMVLPGGPPQIWLEGLDSLDRRYYPVATQIGDMATARVLQQARMRHLRAILPHMPEDPRDGIAVRTAIRVKLVE